MVDLQERHEGFTYLETEYVMQACDQLFECRHCLKWTYVHAYFLPIGSAEKNLFEYLQADLEQFTEQIS